ncbi:MAG: elongation factor P--(R)-beta-lysine ligase, partial [Plesiomonas shigelloides]
MSESVNWQPSAPMSNLLKRASMLADVRRFFADRGVLEVETPAMSQTTLADVYQFPFQLEYQGCDDCESQKLYLVTNPEYHMKRLLAAGSGPIFQLGRSFRNKDADSRHNPEFTILEWYRPCFDMYRLMNEVDDLLQQILDCEPAESLSYQQAFLRHLDIDPLSADKAVLAELVEAKGLTDLLEGEERDCLLHVLFQREVVPNLGQEKPVFVYHFPANQAELAQISSEDHRVAERFQVFYHA